VYLILEGIYECRCRYGWREYGEKDRTKSVHLGERAEVIHRQHGVVDCEHILRCSGLPDERQYPFGSSLRHEQLHAVMAADATMKVGSARSSCSWRRCIIFSSVCRFVIENYRDDAHKVSVFKFCILEPIKEVPTRLMKYTIATSMAVIVRGPTPSTTGRCRVAVRSQ